MNTKFKKVVAILVVALTALSLSITSFAWPANKWNSVNGNGQGTGHKSMIENLSSAKFTCPAAPSDTDYATHKEIVALAAYYTDALDIMDAAATTNGVYSPYHAKTNYTLTEVKQHAKFLYELARRRLVLGKKLDLVSSNYSQTKTYYYDAYIEVDTKNRIIDDLSVLNDELADLGYDMDKIDNQGYMVLGVYFHLLEDIYCHRAILTSSQIDTSGFIIDSSHINYGTSTTTLAQKKTWLKNQIGTSGIPMIRLKDYLLSNGEGEKLLSVPNTTNLVSAAGAYEDNPFFYASRYAAAYSATNTQLSSIMKDVDDACDFSFSNNGLNFK